MNGSNSNKIINGLKYLFIVLVLVADIVCTIIIKSRGYNYKLIILPLIGFSIALLFCVLSKYYDTPIGILIYKIIFFWFILRGFIILEIFTEVKSISDFLYIENIFIILANGLGCFLVLQGVFSKIKTKIIYATTVIILNLVVVIYSFFIDNNLFLIFRFYFSFISMIILHIIVGDNGNGKIIELINYVLNFIIAIFVQGCFLAAGEPISTVGVPLIIGYLSLPIVFCTNDIH